MGSSTSSPLPLETWSVNAVAEALDRLGSKQYGPYGRAVQENAVDGKFLASLHGCSKELEETLDDLGVVNRLHRRILQNKLQQELSRQQQDPSKSVPTVAAPPSAPSSTVTTSNDPTTRKQELDVFDDITLKALDETTNSVFYCGLHLIQGDGYQVLSGKFRDGQRAVPRLQLRNKKNQCSVFVKETKDNFFEEVLWCPVQEPPVVSGHVLKDCDGNRIGTICILDDDHHHAVTVAGCSKDAKTQEKQRLLRQLAAEAERLMRERQAIVERTASLEYQIQLAQQQQESSLPDVVGEELMRHMHEQEANNKKRSSSESIGLVPLDEESDSSSNGNRQKRVKTEEDDDRKPAAKASTADAAAADESDVRDTYRDTKWSDLGHGVTLPPPAPSSASSFEYRHLPSSFFDFVDSMGGARPPLPANDMDVQATVDDMNLLAMTPEMPIGRRIKALVEMTAQLLDFPLAMLVFNDQYVSNCSGIYTRNRQAADVLDSCFRVVTRSSGDDQDTPFFLCSKDRASSICNYPLAMRKPLFLPDLAADKTFEWITRQSSVRSYLGCPLVDGAGRAICNLCLMDVRVRQQLSPSDLAQVEQHAYIILQELQNWAMRNKMEQLEQERLALVSKVRLTKSKPPFDQATVLRAHVENLEDTASVSKDQLLDSLEELFSDLMAKCNGHAVHPTSSDSHYYIAFHDPVDAIAFAMQVQLRLRPGSESLDHSWLGVRFGICHGPVGSSKQKEAGGPTWNMAQALMEMAHGKQIVTTAETWNLASSLGERALGGEYQVLDLGRHVVAKGTTLDEGVIAKNLVQILPQELACDYLNSRRSGATAEPAAVGNVVQAATGVQFPPLKTPKQLSPSFHDAPFADNRVAMTFLYTSEVEKVCSYSHFNNEIKQSLTQLVDEVLSRRSPNFCGYQCKDFMLAFPTSSDAIRFSFDYFKTLRERDAKRKPDQTKIAGLVKFGCVYGEFLTMGPDKHTGRADYFGMVVNRAARVASAAPPGTAVLGVPVETVIENTKDDQAEATALVTNPSPPADLHPSIQTTLLGVRKLRGVRGEIALFECTDASMS